MNIKTKIIKFKQTGGLFQTQSIRAIPRVRIWRDQLSVILHLICSKPYGYNTISSF